MAFFSFFSQAFSWAITILIARILVPGDYGLMSMSTIITGYSLILSDLGLGNAIIQRKNVSENELSSLFWFSMAITTILALSCFPISYLTAFLMHEPRVIPITQTVAILFILNGLQIVPTSLIRKDMNFKAIGLRDMISIIVSSICMLIIAKFNGGVWTLIIGFIIRSFLKTILLFKICRWRPRFHFNYLESKSFISFGLMIALGRSLFYIQEKSDTFFAGRAWKSNLLGYYSFALQLAQIPTEKIVPLINSVSFPAFSKLQDDPVGFNKLYLNISKVTAAIVLPLFAGGYFLGGDLINLILTAKWLPIVPLFRVLCLVQILTSLIAINNFVHAAQGRPQWGLYYYIACVIAMPISFYFAVPYGLNAILIPWTTTFLVLSSFWIFISLRKLGIKLYDYIINMLHPICGTLLMSVFLILLHKIIVSQNLHGKAVDIACLSGSVIIGSAIYFGYFWLIDKQFIFSLRRMLKISSVESA